MRSSYDARGGRESATSWFCESNECAVSHREVEMGRARARVDVRRGRAANQDAIARVTRTRDAMRRDATGRGGDGRGRRAGAATAARAIYLNVNSRVLRAASSDGLDGGAKERERERAGRQAAAADGEMRKGREGGLRCQATGRARCRWAGARLASWTRRARWMCSSLESQCSRQRCAGEAWACARRVVWWRERWEEEL